MVSHVSGFNKHSAPIVNAFSSLFSFSFITSLGSGEVTWSEPQEQSSSEKILATFLFFSSDF